MIFGPETVGPGETWTFLCETKETFQPNTIVFEKEHSEGIYVVDVSVGGVSQFTNWTSALRIFRYCNNEMPAWVFSSDVVSLKLDTCGVDKPLLVKLINRSKKPREVAFQVLGKGRFE
jgi:hypothetical protein